MVNHETVREKKPVIYIVIDRDINIKKISKVREVRQSRRERQVSTY